MFEVKIAIIKWIDSTYYKIEYVEDNEEIPVIRPKFLLTTGMVVYEDDDCMAISQDIIPDTEFKRTILTIPKKSILNIKIETIKIDWFKSDE